MKKRNILKFWHRFFIALSDVVSVVLAMVVAYFSTMGDTPMPSELIIWDVINIIVCVSVFAILGLYSMMLNTVSLSAGIKIVFATLIITVLNVGVVLLTDGKYINVWTVLVFAMCIIFLTICTRYSYRVVAVIKHYFNGGKDIPRVLVVGGGDAGATLIREMLSSDKISYEPVCVVDDDQLKIGQTVCGIKVVGKTSDIKSVVEKYKIDEIFVCMPSVNKKRVSEITKICYDTECVVKILPGIYQFASGQVTVEKMRKVEIADLLGREQVVVDLNEIMGYIEDKVVLVTGGGGSIGSELCRQIASHNPAKLIIFDIYENNAYEIEQELKRKYTSLNLLTLIGSIRDNDKIEDVFKTYRPQIVFHAAAHKHVPLMETSPNEAVKNNVYGTLNVARCADKYEVETFVQISTDKAVNPTNIMGATKRICEMIIQTIGRHSKHTKFVAVRFGNVLGSNGSVIPLFKKQIEEGGPITVTHKDIIRYFMTIPEAVSLVLQAGAYAKGGQIFVLDMGEPVKIYDLAYNLIKLSGLEPNVDIDIVCTGLRPGEKLYEERLMEEEGLQKTENGLISIAKPIDLDEDKLWSTLDRLYVEAYKETDKMKELVKELVPTYKIDKR